MQELLQSIFGWVCGQDPSHTWAPGGLTLPCCQRCTGLYVGACVAGLLHLWMTSSALRWGPGGRPGLSGRFLEAHGLMLLLMVPFGFHWVTQGPVLRGVSGVLFGAAVLTFLWLPLCGRMSQRVQPGAAPYAIGLALTAVAVPFIGACGGRWASLILPALAAGGMAALGLLVGANVLLVMGWLLRLGLGLLARKRAV